MLRCTLVLLSLSSLCIRPAWADTDQFWSFCYYGSDNATGWSVSISGSFLSAPLNTTNKPPTYLMLSAMGVRNQYDASGALVSSVNVRGVAPVHSTQSQNDNLVQTQWPVLTAFGVAFLLDGEVTIPGVSPRYVTNVSSISGGTRSHNHRSTHPLSLHTCHRAAAHSDLGCLRCDVRA